MRGEGIGLICVWFVRAMPQLEITNVMRDTVRAVLDQCSDLSKEERSGYQAMLEEQDGPDAGAALDTLRSLLRRSQQLNDTSNTPRTLMALLRGSKPFHYIPPPPPRVRCPM